MQLSRLHLSGFKSFADETTLEFGAGITAVVGPNGSGKSNIVDALLWCLGERSHKALRGQNATDVIFSGTQSRRATGRAEVNLFFNNESGALPLPQKEVQVSRKLFRDGQGEYGLCGARCRLRDVLDLFLDTGVGPDAYCIISQGEIDAILSAKPEDRRGLIEGAAGIQKYHARRTEARKRLERVEADLTRARDITAELDAQLLPLESQARLARQYDALEARRAWLQLAVLARDLQTRAHRQLELREKQTGDLETIEGARKQVGDLELLELLSNRRLRELEGEVETLASNLTALVGDQKHAEGELAVARERGRALGEIGEFAAREADAMRARFDSLRADQARASSELHEAASASGALAAGAAEAEAKLGDATARLSDATRGLQLLQARVLDAMRASQFKREAAAADRARAESGQTRLTELRRLADNGALDLELACKAEAGAGNSLDLVGKELDLARKDAELRRTLWEAAQNDAKEAAEVVAKAREGRSSLAARLRALRELEQNLEGVAGGTRGVLEAVRRGDLPPDYLPVADAVRAHPRFEVAVETALGAALGHLICPDEASAKSGVAHLKARRAGRATFLPLSALQASFLGERTLRVLGEAGVCGLASRLVDCKEEHDVAVGYLLNRFIVVETLDDALRLVKRCESGARLVSLEGELVLPSGAITGGVGKHKAGGLLVRKRELDELDARSNELERAIEAVTGALDGANVAVAATQEAWRASQNAESEARSRVARAEREAEAQNREVRRLKTAFEAVESQIRALECQVQERADVDAALELDALALEEAARALELEVEQAKGVAQQKQVEREGVRDEVSGVRALFARTGERLEALKRVAAELNRATRESELQIAAKNAQIERAQVERDGLESGEVALLRRLELCSARRDELERALEVARVGRGEALVALEATGVRLKEARERLHSAEDELHRVEVRLAATEAELQDIERRLRNEFGRQPAQILAELQSNVAVFASLPANSASIGAGMQAIPAPMASILATIGSILPSMDAIAATLDSIGASREAIPATMEAEVAGREAKIATDGPELPTLRSGEFDRRAAVQEIESLSGQIGELGRINGGAVAQYDAVKERLDFLVEQKADLDGARDELDAIIAEIDGRMKGQFMGTFAAIQIAFEETFVKVMGGGASKLTLTHPDALLETGIELRVQMPGKAAQDIGLLSGGERALTALSFMMAILKVRPSPFVVLDEVDAPLDQSNVGRFTDLLREFTDTTQFIVITHNNGTMQAADVLYGVTQQEAGVSTLMSVRLADGNEMTRG